MTSPINKNILQSLKFMLSLDFKSHCDLIVDVVLEIVMSSDGLGNFVAVVDG